MPEVRVIWRNKHMNKRTVAMLLEAEKLCKITLNPSQGSYNKGGVAASAGTHDGGGAVDVIVAQYTPAQRKAIVLALRKVGFAAWLRTPSQGKWPYHVHGIAIGDKDLSRGAAVQVAEYKRKRNGLANRGADDGPAGYYGQTWEAYLKAKKPAAPTALTGTAVPDSIISLAALDYARKHDVMGGVWGADRARVMAWAAHPKVKAITPAEVVPPKGVPWHTHFINITKKVQKKFGLTVDGWFGPVTAAATLKKYGYTITA